MGIFGKTMSAIFRSKPDVALAPPASTTTAALAPAPTEVAAAPPQIVDVAAILDNAVAAQNEKLKWRTSIVDLMKALNLDSSLVARKQLAKELHYDGDPNDSVKMNIWLHKQVLEKLAENGGTVPDDLRT